MSWLSLRSKIESRLSALRESVSQTMWHEKADAQIEVLEWVLSLMSDPAPLGETSSEYLARAAFSHIEGVKS